MAHGTAQDLYEIVRRLPVGERLRLVEKIAHDLSTGSDRDIPERPFDWISLAGAAPGLLEGEEAQAWVSETRREADRHRGETPGRRK